MGRSGSVGTLFSTLKQLFIIVKVTWAWFLVVCRRLQYVYIGRGRMGVQNTLFYFEHKISPCQCQFRFITPAVPRLSLALSIKMGNFFYCIFARIIKNRNFEKNLHFAFFFDDVITPSASTPSTKQNALQCIFGLYYHILGQLWSDRVFLRSIVVHCGPLRSIAVHCGPLRYLVGPYFVSKPQKFMHE